MGAPPCGEPNAVLPVPARRCSCPRARPRCVSYIAVRYLRDSLRSKQPSYVPAQRSPVPACHSISDNLKGAGSQQLGLAYQPPQRKEPSSWLPNTRFGPAQSELLTNCVLACAMPSAEHCAANSTMLKQWFVGMTRHCIAPGPGLPPRTIFPTEVGGPPVGSSTPYTHATRGAVRPQSVSAEHLESRIHVARRTTHEQCSNHKQQVGPQVP